MADKIQPTERIRMLYSCACAWRTEDAVDEGESDLSQMRASQGAEFDRWLAAHDAEVKAEALDAILGPIEALHYPANRDVDRTPICADCHGKAGTHPCGCWAEYDQYPICGECGAQEHMPLESDDYPCPTRRACDQIRAELGGGEQ